MNWSNVKVLLFFIMIAHKTSNIYLKPTVQAELSVHRF